MLKSVLAVLSVFAASAFACEPDCRHGLANAFAGHYAPVVQLAVDELEYTFSTSLFNVSVPEEVSIVVPEQALQKGVTASLKETLQIFVDWAAEKPLEDGIYRVMFAEKDPFKGDCNNPKRLDRKMPPEGESWRRDECEKMDYICGNPPSICHFLDDIKQRIVGRVRSQLESYATSDSGFLVRNVVQTIKESVRGVLSQYGAGSMVDDPSMTQFVERLISNAVRTLDVWVSVDVRDLCTKPDHQEICNGWDEEIIPEILKWP
ncbi:hypothetical protein VTP01DRAFT_3142 [Rhizomucor pusillus]|uniref:uncharacterized protein n=1 Tax=Rhizomucor pusillus TaxID=4840 RepID=UPI0037424C42